MGFDLCSRKNDSYFRVVEGFWPHLRMALEFLGADVSRMAVDNSGQYVPAKVAREWAEAIEKGVDGLKMAVVTGPMFGEGKDEFYVPAAFTEKEVREVLGEYYGGKAYLSRKGLSVRIEPLSKEGRRFLMSFARFCRKSEGFEQW